MSAAPATAQVPVTELLALACEHEQAARLPDAERLLRHILAAQPLHADALHLLGIVAYKSGRIDEALDCMERAIPLGLNTPLYYRNICEIYRALGMHELALRTARHAVNLNPADPTALLNFGVVLADQRRPGEAIPVFEQALAIDPALAGAHFGLAEALLISGEFTRGWEEYEWRFRLEGAPQPIPRTDRPQWNGKPIAQDALLLIADQGFGDGIQFGRYISWAARICPNIALACGADLRPLLAQIHPGLRTFTRWEEAGSFAAWCPLTGLPRLAGTTLETIPAEVPYLRADPARIARWDARLGSLIPRGHLRVGLAWAGRPTHKHDRKRSMTLAALAPVFALDGVTLVSVQKGEALRQAGAYYGRAPLISLGAEITDFADTMAIMEHLDLVLAVDTSVAHLAGAMGKPVWIMLPWSGEWRWLENRDDSPWYPTARLFRQPEAGQWEQVARNVAEGLESLRVHRGAHSRHHV